MYISKGTGTLVPLLISKFDGDTRVCDVRYETQSIRGRHSQESKQDTYI